MSGWPAGGAKPSHSSQAQLPPARGPRTPALRAALGSRSTKARTPQPRLGDLRSCADAQLPAFRAPSAGRVHNSPPASLPPVGVLAGPSPTDAPRTIVSPALSRYDGGSRPASSSTGVAGIGSGGAAGAVASTEMLFMPNLFNHSGSASAGVVSQHVVPRAHSNHENATSNGFAAFERSVRRVLDRRPASMSIDAMWRSVSLWIDKYFLAHDSCVLASDAEEAISRVPAASSPKSPARLSTACLVLDEALTLLTHEYSSLSGPVQWARDEVFTWLFANPSVAIDNRPDNTVRSRDVHLDVRRISSYGAKTYRQALRMAASRLPEQAAVEFAEAIKESLLKMMIARSRETSHKYVGLCFRQWRRYTFTSRRRGGGSGGGGHGHGHGSGGVLSSASFTAFSPSGFTPHGDTSDKHLQLHAAALEQEKADMEEALDAAEAERQMLRDRIAQLETDAAAFEHPPPPPERVRAALREAAALEVQVQDLKEAMAGALESKVYPPVGLPATTRQTTAMDLTRAFLTLHAKNGECDFESVSSVVAAYAHALHARCPGIVTPARLNAIVLPDSIKIRRAQLGKLVDQHFGLDAARMDAAVMSGEPPRHVPIVAHLLIGVQRATRRHPEAARIDAALRHQLDYASALEVMLLTGGAGEAADPHQDP